VDQIFNQTIDVKTSEFKVITPFSEIRGTQAYFKGQDLD
jgi:hypothetical protein